MSVIIFEQGEVGNPIQLGQRENFLQSQLMCYLENGKKDVVTEKIVRRTIGA